MEHLAHLRGDRGAPGTGGYAAHGYVFEVDPYGPPTAAPVPLTAMGRFAHEAVAVDPRDRHRLRDRGRVREPARAASTGSARGSRSAGPGSLRAGRRAGGHARADAPADLSAVTGPARRSATSTGTRPGPDYDPLSTDPVGRLAVRRQTANPTRIPKGEGAYWGDGAVLFVSVVRQAVDEPRAGRRHEGQVWRYEPASNTLTLVVRIAPGGTFDGPDNAIASPYGGMFLCEDGDGASYVVGVDETGSLYPFAFNALNDSEFAGATFDRTGRTMFVNVQSPGTTFAITGPWTSRGRNRRA